MRAGVERLDGGRLQLGNHPEALSVLGGIYVGLPAYAQRNQPLGGKTRKGKLGPSARPSNHRPLTSTRCMAGGG